MDGALSVGWDGWTAVPIELALDNSVSLQARAAYALIQAHGRVRLDDLASAGAADPIALVAELEGSGWLTGASESGSVRWTVHSGAVPRGERTTLATEVTAPVAKQTPQREPEQEPAGETPSANTMTSESIVRQWAEQQKTPFPDSILEKLAKEIRAKRELSPLANTGDLIAALNIWRDKKAAPSKFPECYGEALQRSARDVYDNSSSGSSSREVAKSSSPEPERPGGSEQRKVTVPNSSTSGSTVARTRPLPGHCGTPECDNGYIEQDDGRVRKCPKCLPEPTFGRRAFDLPRQAHYVAAQNKQRLRANIREREDDSRVVDVDGSSNEGGV
ncbi:hypothetical protein [Actinopolyspora saharensis]|uniref:Uncharacterized protein n=1 Tax=Actinopolyspora saharensis TaxID=995062 RepID=A0A1H1G9E9_9ACTN|nr:hypothetical protein [Actinopolyspora saharensis]SDR09725.1 hypothetical protein SAMN04489718_3502 [Actinopolyspora saharensis]